jgi:RNA polymerase sigma factor (sigma-70 family)
MTSPTAHLPIMDQPTADLAADFTAFYRAEFDAVAALVQSFTGRRDVAEEIAQDAFVVTHARWRRVGGYDKPGAYVRRVALHRAVSSFRRRQAERRALDRLGRRTDPPPASTHTLDQQLWAEVRKLPDRQAQAIALVYVEDRTVAQVAAILGTSESSVKTHLRRARATLAGALAALDGDHTRSPR